MTEKKKNSCFDEIVSIEDVGEFPTYDFTVPGTHCFFANGILVHNSGELEELSDIVIKLFWPFREWTLHPDKDRPNEKEYEVTVMKNRHGPCGQVEFGYEPQYSRMYSEPQDNNGPTLLSS